MPSEIVDLDLSSAKSYMSSLGLLRQAVVLGREKAPGLVLRLRVRLVYEGRVTLYMKVSNLYIIAFGENPVFALADSSEDTAATLRASGAVPKEIPIHSLDLGSDHNALGTERHRFGLGDLAECAALARFNGRQEYNTIRKPLSLLVCMLAEGSRFLEVQNLFAGIGRPAGEYWSRALANKGIFSPTTATGAGESDLQVSGVIWVWQKATRLRHYANTAHVGPAEGSKLVAELRAMVMELRSMLGASGAPVDREVVLFRIAGAPLRLGLAPSAVEVKLSAAKELAARFGARTKEQISDLLGLFADEMVMKAVQGLLVEAV